MGLKESTALIKGTGFQLLNFCFIIFCSAEIFTRSIYFLNQKNKSIFIFKTKTNANKSILLK